MRTVPSRHEPDSCASRPWHAHELHRASAEVQHATVVQRRRVRRREIAIARLLLAVEHPDRQSRALARSRQEALRVVGFADRARRHRVDRSPVQAACLAEVSENVERLQRARHRRVAEAAGLLEPLADAHRLIDLVRSLPPALAGGEHDEPKGARAEIDHRQALVVVHVLSVIATAADFRDRCGSAARVGLGGEPSRARRAVSTRFAQPAAARRARLTSYIALSASTTACSAPAVWLSTITKPTLAEG